MGSWIAGLLVSRSPSSLGPLVPGSQGLSVPELVCGSRGPSVLLVSGCIVLRVAGYLSRWICGSHCLWVHKPLGSIGR